jgi:signal transduction histidine kinase
MGEREDHARDGERADTAPSEGKARSVDPALRALGDALPFALWMRDAAGHAIYANPASQSMWPGSVGRRPEESSVSEAVRARWVENNARALRGEPVTGTVEYETAAGRGIYYGVLVPFPDDRGAIAGTIGVNVDLTALHAAEAALRGRDALLASIFDASAFPLGIREIHGDEIVHVVDNAASASLHGTTTEEIAGRTERALGLSEEANAQMIERFRAARAAGAALRFEQTYANGAGARILRGRVAPIARDAAVKGGDAGPERYVVAAEDVTELRALEARLLHAERLATVGTLAAGVGHEIKNPLTSILLDLEYAASTLRGVGGAGEAAAAVSSALSAAGRLTELVRDFLRFARPHGATTTPVDLRMVIESALGLTAAQLRGVARVVCDLEPVAPIVGDGVLLSQAIVNLVLNAAQAISAKGSGEVRLEMRGLDDGAIVVRVDDDGPGIAPEIRDRLGTPFETTKSDGSGLGLFVCRQIVELHGGTLAIFCRPEGGTRAEIILPATAVRADDDT